ncbi:MAG: thioredoxin domain-containing protein [Candidatus Paceibacterota bacterium]
MKSEHVHEYSTPIAIVIAGVVIAGAIVASGGNFFKSDGGFGNSLSRTAEAVNPVDSEDHIKGNPEAQVSIIEYSDYECPFCARVHSTLEQIIEDFDGEVRWVYRHFPLTTIHSNAFAASVAGECVARLGGNDAFWSFTDTMLNGQELLGRSLYERTASELGISVESLNTCINRQDVSDSVTASAQNAIDAGGRGTPYMIVVNKNGEKFPFSGALSYQQIRVIVADALK